ncbi:uncharacterized protein LOC118180962 isoform X2 [Stegodyphus dumicola]|uniref:uncharacterized protein LOC118180962 isoform X2 n=1 Tax=Stegodyphus dumicola TaxID=202533 RepID=UPI0015AB91B9|nr:uncharacterized protein LOC118180962 isoform X2 [Stegodyphus dumicola]
MLPLSFLLISISSSCISYMYAWPHSEADDSDESLSLIPRTWKKNTEKKNTWWSKKSVVDEDISDAAADILKLNQEVSPTNKIEGCFTDRCMFLLMECLRQGESRVVFMKCRESHFSCFANCIKENRDRYLFNSVPMPS